MGRAKFEGPAAERYAAAQARVAAAIEAAGGREAYLAKTAEAGRRAAAQRRAEAAQAAVAAAERALAKAQQTAQAATATAEGRWVVVSANGGVEGYGTVEAAEAAAEWFRAAGIGATTYRPYCGHGYDRYRPGAPGTCPTCAREASRASIPGRES